VKEGLTKVKGEARERQLQLREEKIATALSSKQQSFADAANAYGMDLQTEEEYVAGQVDSSAAKWEKEAQTKEMYRLIVEGRCEKERKYATQFGNWGAGKRCLCHSLGVLPHRVLSPRYISMSTY
jgi:hypothetical protein